jgi:uncharacterized membrane protein
MHVLIFCAVVAAIVIIIISIMKSERKKQEIKDREERAQQILDHIENGKRFDAEMTVLYGNEYKHTSDSTIAP